MTGLASAVAGLVAGIASLLLLRVETPPAGRHFSITQDILGLLAFAGLFGFVSAGLLAGVAWGRRPAAEVDRSGVRVFDWRAVRVPWPMITEVTTVRDGKGIRPALLLANRQVLSLRFAGQVASDDAESLGLLDAALLKYHRKQHAKARARWAAKPLLTCRARSSGATSRDRSCSASRGPDSPGHGAWQSALPCSSRDSSSWRP